MTFTYPYLEDTTGHVDLSGRLGFIYGSIAFCSLIFAFFFIPKTELLELEDIAIHRIEEMRKASNVEEATTEFRGPGIEVDYKRGTSLGVAESKE